MRIACAQIPVRFGDFKANLRAALATLEEAATMNVDLVVFPECFLTGYCVVSRQEAARIAVPASALSPVSSLTARLGVGCVVGFAESDAGSLYNSAALIEPGVPARFYRKTHLPELGFDKHALPGDRLEVYATRWGAIGVLICFDLRHPEPSRVLAVSGADLIVLPTNWPQGAFAGPRFIAPARAAENKVFLATCNRPDSENGFRFIGSSGVYGVDGEPVALAGEDAALIFADINLAEAREKRTVVRPGAYEIVVLESRRPKLYGRLTAQEMSSRV